MRSPVTRLTDPVLLPAPSQVALCQGPSQLGTATTTQTYRDAVAFVRCICDEDDEGLEKVMARMDVGRVLGHVTAMYIDAAGGSGQVLGHAYRMRAKLDSLFDHEAEVGDCLQVNSAVAPPQTASKGKVSA